MKPQISIVLKTFSDSPRTEWNDVLDLAQAADRAGVDRLVVPDHVVFGENLEAYGRPELGGRAGGVQPTGPDGSWLEPMTTLAVIAGLTKRIRLGTSVLLAALRRPVVLAKAAASLDVLSGGRLDLGVGVGWQQAEYDAAGLDFARRGRLLDHTLEVCQALWREGSAAYRSEELRFADIHLMPKPAQAGGVPIWVSGTVTRSVARRLARFGSGWIPWGSAADDLVPSIERMRGLVAELGSDPTQFGIVGALTPHTMDLVPRMARAGVTDFRMRATLPRDASSQRQTLARLVDEFREVASRAC